MKRRICVIGNSHVAPLKMAWDDFELPEVEMTFFASRGNTLRELVCRDGALHPVSDGVRDALKLTSGGDEKVQASRFDAFVVVGLGSGVFNVATIYRTHRLAKHITHPSQHPITEACLRQSAMVFWRRSAAMGLVAKIRALSNAPIFLSPDPYASELIDSSARYGEYWQNYDIVKKFHTLHVDYLNEATAQGEVGFIRQPVESIAQGVYTAKEFAKRHTLRPPLDSVAMEYDLFHTNRRFGQLLLEKLFGMISAISQTGRDNGLARSQPNCKAVASDSDE